MKKEMVLKRRVVGIMMIVLCVFSAGGLAVDAQDAPAIDPDNLYFEVIELPVSVRDFLQDRDGFFWLGTTADALRYDGSRFKSYPDLPAYTLAVYEDQAGVLWYITLDSLAAYHKQTATTHTYTPNPEDSQALPAGFAQDRNQYVAEDRQGGLWFATVKGLVRFDRDTEQFTTYRADPQSANSLSEDQIISVLTARDGMLWVGTQSALHRVDPTTGQVITCYRQENDETNALHGDFVSALWEDEQGILWIGTSGGLNRLDPRTETFSHYTHAEDDPKTLSHNDIRSLFITPELPGYLWIGTFGGGLNLLGTATGRVIRYAYDEERAGQGGIASNTIWQIIRGKQPGVIYVLTPDEINRIDPGARPFVSYTHQPDNPAQSLAAGWHHAIGFLDLEGNLWNIAAKGAFSKIDPRTGVATNFSGHPDLPQNLTSGAFWFLPDGSFWAADHDRGLVRVDPVKETIIQTVPADMSADPIGPLIDATNPDIFWSGSVSKGLFKFNHRTGESSYFPPDANDPKKFKVPFIVPYYQDTDGYIWLLELGAGFSKFDPRSEQVVVNYQHDPDDKQTLASNSAAYIYVDSQDRYWIGHLEFGPDRFDPGTGVVERFVDRYGKAWPAAAIGSLMMGEDSRGNLWAAGTLNGTITRFNPETGETRVYTEQDGVAPSIGCGVGFVRETEDGKLWMFGTQGITAFHPEQVQDNAYQSPVYLTELAQAGQPIPLDTAVELVSEIHLAWDANFFEFEMAALNYRRPEQNQYQYMLQGLDEQWFESGVNRQGRYAGLGEGMYILEVNGSNNDGIWSEHPARLNIYVEPHIPEGVQLVTLDDIRQGNAVSLPAEHNSLMFEAAPLDFSILTRQQYRYQLAGYDEREQVITSARYIHYANVPEGRYSFIVTNTDDNTTYRLPVTLRPPFYRAWWFQAGAAALVFAGVAGGLILRIKASEMRRRELEQKVEERTQTLADNLERLQREIAERQRIEVELHAAKAEAESANNAKSEFLAHMSHELRTPLNGILGYVQLLEQDNTLTEDQQSGLRIIQRSGQHLLNLINDILHLARIEARKMDLHPTEVALPEFLQDITALMKMRAQQKGLDFHYAPDSSLPAIVLIDRQRLEQVLLNLLNNAVKFTEQGRVTFRIENCRLNIENCKETTLDPQSSIVNLQFSISDTGIGIPADKLTAIFDPFERVGGHTHPIEGTGLGLPISQQLVQLMGGRIEVSSQPGQGSAFWFELTLPVKASTAITTFPAKGGRIGFEGACKVLIVDDTPSNRRLLGDMLRPLGFDVREAGDGASGIATAIEFQPDVIVLDVMLPDMDGAETARRLRQIETLRDTVLIGCSASVSQTVQERMRSSGCCDFLPKPVHYDRLLDCLEEHLTLRWQYRPHDEGQSAGQHPLHATDVTLPSRKDLQILYDFAQRGDILEVEAYAKQLAGKEPAYANFSAKLIHWRKNLDIFFIRQYLKQSLQE